MKKPTDMEAAILADVRRTLARLAVDADIKHSRLVAVCNEDIRASHRAALGDPRWVSFAAEQECDAAIVGRIHRHLLTTRGK